MRIGALRTGVVGTPWRNLTLVEMHGRFTPAATIALARDLEPFAPGWIEEPVPPENLRALAKVSERVAIPVATGERLHTRYDFRELFELQAADVVQPDITHVGGPVATAANLHLAACTPNFKIQEHFNDFADAWVRDVAPGLPEVGDDGCFPMPGAPGLGVRVDWDAVAEHPRENVHFDLNAPDWQFREARR